jgi:hypothetical protein
MDPTQEGKLKRMLSQIGPHLVTLMTLGEQYKLWSFARCTFLQSLSLPDIPVRACPLHTPSVWSSLNMRDQFSQPHRRLCNIIVVGLEVVTPVVMERSVSWDIEPCNLLKVNRRFGIIAHGLLPPLPRFFAWLILRPWKWWRHIPPKRWLIFSGLHVVISHKIGFFKIIVLYIVTCSSDYRRGLDW